MIHRRNFFAHRLGDFPRIQQPANGHRPCNGGESPANVERFPQQEERDNFRSVVQATGETHRSRAQKMRGIDNFLRSEAEEITAVAFAAASRKYSEPTK